MHQVSSSIDEFPIVNNHWYLIKIVFNAGPSEVVGSDGIPVDIFIDDQGSAADDFDENWAGCLNWLVMRGDSHY